MCMCVYVCVCVCVVLCEFVSYNNACMSNWACNGSHVCVIPHVTLTSVCTAHWQADSAPEGLPGAAAALPLPLPLLSFVQDADAAGWASGAEGAAGDAGAEEGAPGQLQPSGTPAAQSNQRRGSTGPRAKPQRESSAPWPPQEVRSPLS